MSFVTVLDLILQLLEGTLTALGANDKYRKVTSEVREAVVKIEAAKQEALTNTQLESLRTTPQW